MSEPTNQEASAAAVALAEDTRDAANMDTLKAMFPNVDVDIIEAVLSANNSNLDAAINGLIEISDPTKAASPTGEQNGQSETAVPTSPDTQAKQKQLQDDEALAKALAVQMQDEELARRIQEEEHLALEQAEREAAARSQLQNDEDEDKPSEWEQKLDQFGQKVEEKLDNAAKSIKTWFNKLTSSNSTNDEASNPINKQSQDPKPYSNLPSDDDELSVMASPVSPKLGQTDFDDLNKPKKEER